MAAAMGLGAVLGRTPPPVPDSEQSPSAVLAITGFPDPGPMAAADWFTAWRPNWLMVAIAVLAVGLYAVGVTRLSRRGDAWPVHRTILWTLGWIAFVWATSGAPDIWGRVLFSVHMVMHMVVAMVVPLLLVPAAPLTLALRALPARQDRTWGPREVILQVVHSRAMKVLANPVVAAALFFGSLAAFYWSPLFELALTTHSGHLLMLAHFFLTGYLFTWVLIGIDPGPPKWSPAILLLILFATISFHAFFGVALTGTKFVLAPGFFEQINLPWGPQLLADQERAGEIAWGFGEAPTLVLAILVARQWFRRDRQETVRLDRQADRDDDAALRAYNERLGHLGGEASRASPGAAGPRRREPERADQRSWGQRTGNSAGQRWRDQGRVTDARSRSSSWPTATRSRCRSGSSASPRSCGTSRPSTGPTSSSSPSCGARRASTTDGGRAWPSHSTDPGSGP